MLSRSVAALLAPARLGQAHSRRGAASTSSGGISQALQATFGIPPVWSIGLARVAAGSAVILAGAATLRRFGTCCVSDGASGDASADAAAVRRAFRLHCADGDSFSLRRVRYTRLQELVATGRVDELHVCSADSALYAFEKTPKGWQCYRVGAMPSAASSRCCCHLGEESKQQGQAASGGCSAERMALRLVEFRDHLVAADTERGLKPPPPLRLAWHSGAVLGAPACPKSSVLTPGTVTCISAWAAFCLRWRLLYVAAPLAVLYTLPILILREQR